MTMKKIATFFALALFLGGFPAGVWAVDETTTIPPEPREAPYPGQSIEEGTTGQMEGERERTIATARQVDFSAANDLEGLPVLDHQGRQVGEVDRVLVDAEQGEVAYVIVSQAGAREVGDEQYVIPWGAIRADSQQNGLLLTERATSLRSIPEDVDHVDRQQGAEIHQHYGVSPYWEDTAE